MSSLSAWLWLQLGRWLGRKGLSAQAQACMEQASACSGRWATDAALFIGRRLIEQGQHDAAIEHFLALTHKQPGEPRAWCGLGAAQRHAGAMEAARAAFEQALALAPDYPQALNNLGEWWLMRDDPERALVCFERILARDPGFYEAVVNRVAALAESGRVVEAEAAANEALARYPDSAPLHVNLGNLLVHSGRGRPGVLAYRRALELDPQHEEARYNLAILQCDMLALEAAMNFITRQLAIRGDSPDRLVMYATALKSAGRLAEALTICRRIAAEHPAHVSNKVLLASCLSAAGDAAAAAQTFEETLTLRPEMAAIYSNVLFELTYLPDLPAQALFDRHRDWAQRYEAPFAARRYVHPRGDDPERRLHIGYISGDFCNHPVGTLFRGIVRHHSLADFEIHCYSNFHKEDGITREIRDQVDRWCDVSLQEVELVAQQIHDDGIDILIDLSGHTALNRLPAMVFKPAPIQATWIGYFHSTGLESIDYFITDPYTSPRGCGQHFSETPVYLPHSRFCYTPPDYATPCVDRDPADGIVFGSFNRLSKITPPVIAAWAAILAGTPGSRLLLKTRGVDESPAADMLRARFAACGIGAERLVLRAAGGHERMFMEYGDIDIALDPFPFTGGITSFEAMWMGVPVITLAGQSVVARQTTAMLANIDLADLSFADVDAYVAGAIRLAGDETRRIALRRTLRPRMQASPLCTGKAFARDLEALYRRMWRAWCAGQKLPSDIVA
jgi:predicted O-linked N-acetylglucosamine transferase (SPINDLY family)